MTERADKPMPDPDEKTMREVYDRIHSLERSQGTYLTEFAVLKTEVFAAITRIEDMLKQIVGGKTENCLVHKAELEALRLDMTRNHEEFVVFKKERVEALDLKADKGSVKALWWVCGILGAAMMTGLVTHLFYGR